MINLRADHPTELWTQLARLILRGAVEPDVCFNHEDTSKFISYNNILQVTQWPAKYEAKALYWAVGYELNGNKMTRLWNHYVDEASWLELRKNWSSHKGNRPISLGMHFKRTVEGAGGCLGSFEIFGTKTNPIVFIHSKTAEFPKKFTADVRLISLLLSQLYIDRCSVTWYLSSLWTSRHLLKGICNVIGKRDFIERLGSEALAKNTMKYMKGYLEPTQVRIANHRKELPPKQRWMGMEIELETGDHYASPRS